MAEVVKTGLLSGHPVWELEEELIRACAAFKAGVCLGDPFDTGRRAILNLGHTFAHALEAAAGYDGLTHGRAVALGLLAALRLSGGRRMWSKSCLHRNPFAWIATGPGTVAA